MTHTIISPSGVEVTYKLAGAGSRLAAFLIDFAVQILFIIILIWAMLFRNISPSGTILAALYVTVFGIYFGYFIVLEFFMKGQSIGKRIMRLRVIRANGQPVELPQILIRGFMRSAVDIFFVGFFAIISKHRRLGDMAAGTFVVCERHDRAASLPFFSAPGDWPEDFPDPMTLSSKEKSIVFDWLRRRDSLPDRGEGIRKMLQKYFSKN